MISSPESLVPFSVADRTELADTAPSSTFEALSGTVLKFEGAILSTNPFQPAASDQTVAAMQRLVELITTLRTSELSSTDAATPWQTDRTQTPEALAPYITEEAYEVLDTFKVNALAAERIEPNAPPPASSTSLITVETLILHLLWSIARSSYTAMQLIEGVKVRCLQPDQTWADGMLRLAALLETSALETEAETLHRFDIATGQPPTQLLNGNDRIQSDDNSLPIKQSFKPINGAGNRGDRVEHHLQELIQQFQTAPLLAALLKGVSIERLQPEKDWQSGQLRLKLGFEFVAQSATLPKFDWVQFDLVEAELVEDSSVDLSWRYPNHADPHALSRRAGVHVLVRELPGRSLSAATLIRLADPQQLHGHTQAAIHQSLVKSIAQLQQPAQTRDSDNLLDLIVQAAWQSATHSPVIEASYSLLQPELLMDELVPKLLWQLTRSAYEVMQLIGGIEANVLQPSSTWQSGTLRLLAILQIEADGINYKIDLATGRLLTHPLRLLSPTAVCQPQRSGNALSQSSVSIICQEPVQAATILSCLLRQIRAATPEIELFLDGVAIEWLEAEQDWQPGVLTLSLGLEFNSTHF